MTKLFNQLHAATQGVFCQEGGALFRVWAPRAKSINLLIWPDGWPQGACQEIPMKSVAESCGDGYYEAQLKKCQNGLRYAYLLDGRDQRPDPASRWQPDGVHLPSAVYFPEEFSWSDRGWSGLNRKELVLYELHVGTFTAEGTFEAVISRLPDLKDLGVTAIELLPIAQFPGGRNWGYDGVHPYAAQNTYGGPEGLQRLVQAAHQHGLGVFLDVVYNHLGPEGSYVGQFGPYFTDRYHTPWGDAINLDGEDSDPVRRFVVDNACQWVRDFHLDGLRLDAVHAIFDYEATHVLEEIQHEVQEIARQENRSILVIAESNQNNVRLIDPPEKGGYNLDGVWADDFHHAVHTLLTGESEGYYRDFGSPEDLLKAYREAFVYNGLFSIHRRRRHGNRVGNTPRDRFCVCIQNHDQVGNRAMGDRFGTLLEPSAQRLAAGLLLISPFTPLLFMGEEYGEKNPFPFFCSFIDKELIEAVRVGRREEFAKHAFQWETEPPDPQSEETFAKATLTWQWPEGTHHAGLRRLYQDLLAARRRWPELRERQGDIQTHSFPVDGQPDELPVICLHYQQQQGSQQTEGLLILANLSAQPQPRPPVEIGGRHLLMSTAEARYGGPSDPDSRAEASDLISHELMVFGSR